MTATSTNDPFFGDDFILKSAETCKTESKKAKNLNNVVNLFKRPSVVQPPAIPIPKTPGEVISLVRAAAKTFSGDPAATAELLQGIKTVAGEMELHGHPSGSSLPAAAPALELPTFPRWKDHREDETIVKWLETHYKKYIDAGLITRSFFQEKGQDKTFYTHLLEWEKKNTLPDDLHIPTKSELLARERQDMGADAAAIIRQGARLYQAVRRHG